MIVQNDYLDLHKTAESGQCFRMRETAPGCFTLIAGSRLLHLRTLAPGKTEFLCPDEEFWQVWHRYFDLDTNYAFMEARVPASDTYLSAAVSFGRGIRILRQDPWEMFVTFILSQRRSIPAIKKSVETLCTRYGEQMHAADGETYYAFPTAEALSGICEQEFRDCAVGYRAPYLCEAASLAASGRLDLAAMAKASPAEWPDEAIVMTLECASGVGPKVANCVLLFGFHRIDAFPKDVWINRVIDTEYNGHFPVERYHGFAGVIQQYLFYYARNGQKK